MISSELLEVIGMSDRTLVMRDGRSAESCAATKSMSRPSWRSRPIAREVAVMIGYFRRNQVYWVS
jgi:hypothetical protein